MTPDSSSRKIPVSDIRAKMGRNPPVFNAQDVRALQSLDRYARKGDEAGIPQPQDCQRALDWIIKEASGYYGLTDNPDDGLQKKLEGRRHVGFYIVTLLNLAVGKIDFGKTKEPRAPRTEDGEE